MSNTTTKTAVETFRTTRTNRQWTVVEHYPVSDKLRAALGVIRQAAVKSAKGRPGLLQVFADHARVVTMNATTEFVTHEDAARLLPKMED